MKKQQNGNQYAKINSNKRNKVFRKELKLGQMKFKPFVTGANQNK